MPYVPLALAPGTHPAKNRISGMSRYVTYYDNARPATTPNQTAAKPTITLELT